MNRLEEKLTNLESENKVLRQQALSMAQNNKVVSDLEAENKSLRQQILTMSQSHKLLAGRSKSVIQVILEKRRISLDY